MHQVKLFKGVESDINGLEKEVNAWLAESGVRVVELIGNIAPQTLSPDEKAGSKRMYPPSDVLLAVLYEKT